MINIKPVILAALKNDAALTVLLNGQHVYRQFPAESVNFDSHSLIVYSETSNKPMVFGDEIEIVAKITFQIDVWSKASTSEIAMAVDRIMVKLGGTRIDAPDDDQDAPRQCKAMAYEFVVDNEGTIF
jgi:hypothetical protein